MAVILAVVFFVALVSVEWISGRSASAADRKPTEPRPTRRGAAIR